MLHHHHHGHSPPLALIFTISGDEVGTATNIIRFMPWLFNNLILCSYSIDQCKESVPGVDKWPCVCTLYFTITCWGWMKTSSFWPLRTTWLLQQEETCILGVRRSRWFEWNAIHNNIVNIKIIRNPLTVIIAGQVWPYCDNFLQTVSGTKLMKQLHIIVISNGVISTITISNVTITMASFPMHLGANQSSREPTKAPRSQPKPRESTQFVKVRNLLSQNVKIYGLIFFISSPEPNFLYFHARSQSRILWDLFPLQSNDHHF